MKDGLDNSGFGFGNDSVTVNLTSGQIITIEGKEYTVIENVEGNKYKVLTNDTFEKAFDVNNSDNYATSTIATYLDNDYCNSLDESIRNAIVDTSIQQKVLKTWGGNNPTDWDTPKDAGTHKVFLPSWDELTKATGGTDAATLKTFFNSKYVWLRDTYNSVVLFVNSNGILYHYNPSKNYGVRPAFVLNLSKVEYTIK